MERLVTTICLLLFFLSGCSFYDDFAVSKMQKRQAYLYSHPDLKYNVRVAIMNGKILIGMTQEQVAASWGDPDIICKGVYGDEQWLYGVDANNTLEQWFHDVDVRGRRYLHFEDGILIARRM